MLDKLYRRIFNRIRDIQLNISTGGIVPSEAKDHIHYATVSYSCTEFVLRRLKLTATDTFVDVGCGKGRVTCLAGRFDLSEVVGIEYSSTLADIAERNANRLRGRRSKITIRRQSAETSDYSRATVLYFFNPFESSILDSVLHKIRTDRSLQPTRLVFVMESEAQRAVFSAHTWLTCYERFDDSDRHSVAFYCNLRVCSSPGNVAKRKNFNA